MAGSRRAYKCDGVPIGTGGQAQVFRAVRKADGAELALKRVPRLGPPDQRLRREIKVMQSICSPHVMPLLDWGEDKDVWYVMPLATGTLKDLVASFRDPVKALFSVIDEVLDGLASAHALGHIHRDIKPSNILRLENGPSRWVLADWGLVRHPHGETTTHLTRDGASFGTELFAAPECYRSGHEADARADIYSVGRVVAWALGKTLVPNIPAIPDGTWERFVRRTTELDPGKRPSSVAEVRTILEQMKTPALEEVLGVFDRFKKRQGDLQEEQLREEDAARRLSEGFGAQYSDLIDQLARAVETGKSSLPGLSCKQERNAITISHERFSVNVREHSGLFPEYKILVSYALRGDGLFTQSELRGRDEHELEVVETELLWDGYASNERLVANIIEELLGLKT